MRLTERELFPRVRRECESKDGHRRDEEARHDQVEEVVESPTSDPHHKGDVQVRFRTAVVDHFVPGSRHACEKQIHYSSDALVVENHCRCFYSVCHNKMENYPNQCSFRIFGQFLCTSVGTPMHGKLFYRSSTAAAVEKTSPERGFGIVEWQGTPRILQATPHSHFKAF